MFESLEVSHHDSACHYHHDTNRTGSMDSHHRTLPRNQRSYQLAARTRAHRLSEAVEGIAKAILPKECVPGVYRLAVGAEPENVTPLESKSYVSEELVELRSPETYS